MRCPKTVHDSFTVAFRAFERGPRHDFSGPGSLLARSEANDMIIGWDRREERARSYDSESARRDGLAVSPAEAADMDPRVTLRTEIEGGRRPLRRGGPCWIGLGLWFAVLPAESVRAQDEVRNYRTPILMVETGGH